MTLDRQAGQAALDRLAAQANMDAIDLASSIVEIANENMASAIKMVSIERGHDPRRFALSRSAGQDRFTRPRLRGR